MCTSFVSISFNFRPGSPTTIARIAP